jgi:IS1 family transposase
MASISRRALAPVGAGTRLGTAPLGAHGRTDDCGDCWTWLAIDADSKLILSHAVGQRDESTCVRFLRRLNGATLGQFQVTSDGLGLYTNNVPFELGSRISFAQLVKSYSASQEETRYSPATITGIEIVPRFGNPDLDEVSTSYSERLNLSVRMHIRRYTRLTNAHSNDSPPRSDDQLVCGVVQLLPKEHGTSRPDAGNGGWSDRARLVNQGTTPSRKIGYELIRWDIRMRA